MQSKRRLILFLIVCSITCLVACNSQDQRITKEVLSRLLHDGSLTSAKIDVSTHHGTVTLDGKVIGQTEADHAIQIARSVPGVRAVDTHLEIDTHITNKEIHERVEQGQEAAQEQNQQQQTKP